MDHILPDLHQKMLVCIYIEKDTAFNIDKHDNEIKFNIGDHSVEVKLGGSHVEGSPFLVKAYNADKVKVTDINSGVVGKPVFFSSKLYIFN